MDVNRSTMIRTKRCTKCGVEKYLFKFSKHDLTHDGHAYQCKECNAKRAKEWRKTTSAIYTNIRGRVKFYKHKPLEIDRDTFVSWYDSQERICVYCDLPEEKLWILQEEYDNRVTRLTVDCKDNLVGYTLDNLALACERCNAIKSNILSFDEMMYVGQNFIKPKWQRIEGEKANE